MRRIKSWHIVGNVGDGNLLETLRSLAGVNSFAVHTISGTVMFLPSLGGGVFDETPLVLTQEPAIVADLPEPEGSFLVITNPDRLAWFQGDFASLQIIQRGASAVELYIRAGGNE